MGNSGNPYSLTEPAGFATVLLALLNHCSGDQLARDIDYSLMFTTPTMTTINSQN